MQIIITIPILVLCLCDCNRWNDKEFLLNYLSSSKHGLKSTVTLKDNQITAIYKPQSLFAAQDIETNNLNRDRQVSDSILHYYSQYLYFSLSFSRNGNELLNSYLSDENTYTSAIEYLAFKIKAQSVIFTENKDTLHAIDCSFSRLYGSTKNNEVLLVFENKLKKSKELYLKVFASELITENLEFRFKIKDIKRIPNLKI